MKAQANIGLKEARLPVSGFCCICGNVSEFQVEESQWGSVRESMNCNNCGSSARKRHVVKTMLEIFAPHYKTLETASQTLRELSVYSAVSKDNLHLVLGSENPKFVCSEYLTGITEGDYKDGVLCQNLERLTFQDQQFDLVITEDVFEHIRRPCEAFKEVYRVLKPNGCHVFTIPFTFHQKTVTRVATTTEEDIFLLPPSYHIDPIRDKALVYTDFGYDLFDKLSLLGFETHVVSSLYRDAVDFGIADSFVFVSRKISKQ